MPVGTLYAGPRYPALESVAFAQVAARSGSQPSSLLYLARNDHTADQSRERWRHHSRPHALDVDTFDGLVADCYEREQYAGRITHIDQPLRDRLVELAVERLTDPANPLYTTGFPAQGLCEQVEDLLSLLEFADLHSPTAIRDRLEAEGLDTQAETAQAIARAFEAARETLLDDHAAETFRAERYHHVATTATDLTELRPHIDAVVLGGFSLFSPLERQLVERIAETWPTVALLPQLTDSDDAVGVDRGAERALEAYQQLGFDREYVSPADSNHGRTTARQLYRPASATPTAAASTDLDLIQPETRPQELRHVARDIRARIADGTPAETLGIVLSAPGAYHERLVETLEQYGIPATLAIERSFGDTALGEVLSELASLSRDDPPLDAVTALVSNQLVHATDSDVQSLTRVASRLTSRRLETAYEHLPDESTAALQSLVADAQALRETALADLPAAFETLLDDLGVADAIDDLPRTPRGRTEKQAAKRLDRTLETLAMTDGYADLDRGDAVDRLERALRGVTLDADGGREDGHVLVCGLDEAAPHEFDHAYVLGLTEGQFPSNPERLAFTRPINEAHADFQQADIQQRARYHFGTLLASDASLTLSVPERDLEGDPFVEADVITELRRVTDHEPDPVTPTDTPPGAREDVQRSLARTFAHDGTDDYTPAIDRAADVGTFDAPRRERLHAGTACAAARASPDLTPYDGQLSAETVATLHGRDTREPYSPSRLETYATCGFKYYMQRVLDIEDPDEIGLEPDARVRGGFVHDVLEHYYAELQPTPGVPVSPVANRTDREAHLLDVALASLTERFDDDPTAFQREWLVQILAGLGDPEDNPYYGDDSFGDPERGLLVRYLDHEFGEVAKSTALPAWFEARVGAPRGDEVVLQTEPVQIDTPHGTVPIHGKIDRIDVVPDSSPTQLVVRDYKTGTTPSEADTLSGLAFQLPLYALLAEGVLENVETVGGSYYQVKPPRHVSHRKGLIGSQEHASYYDSDDVDTPLLRARYPAFETHEAFRRFIETETPVRLGQLAAGLDAGRFHPTVLDPGDAGCRYCGYSDVCDVRSHRRRDVIEHIDDGVDAYVPLAARDAAIEDALEVE
ncbi:PD-(D/E)XK nuclease family protein [Halorarius litoreus]|uniref:PD-(D/E)XK nuclease family protein n=1 Tax=Halorarius litoreus TaxID=2962676 RepID=UPI0020CDCE57|nr:PD-(D/E)XK nuclease family protein [Halorarius litoreus]